MSDQSILLTTIEGLCAYIERLKMDVQYYQETAKNAEREHTALRNDIIMLRAKLGQEAENDRI